MGLCVADGRTGNRMGETDGRTGNRVGETDGRTGNRMGEADGRTGNHMGGRTAGPGFVWVRRTGRGKLERIGSGAWNGNGVRKE